MINQTAGSHARPDGGQQAEDQCETGGNEPFDREFRHLGTADLICGDHPVVQHLVDHAALSVKTFPQENDDHPPESFAGR